MHLQKKERNLLVDFLLQVHISSEEKKGKIFEAMQNFLSRKTFVTTMTNFSDVVPVSSRTTALGEHIWEAKMNASHIAFIGKDEEFDFSVLGYINGEENIEGVQHLTFRGIIDVEPRLPFRGQSVLRVIPNKKLSVSREQG